ncbi:MAG: response regulator transcription factor [Phycisphaerales bacterium]|nr:response regulator transcription factor [Phycisphaerales bacterium]
MSRPITVLLVDDHALVRNTLSAWLRQTGRFEIVGAAADADTAVTEAIRLQPDVVVMDIDMPGLLAFDAARVIRSRSPGTRILFLSAYFHDRYIEEALNVEASGYIGKGQPPERVAEAIATVASGGVSFAPEVQSRIVIDQTGLHLAGSGRTRTSTLTPRELEVLRYVARGMAKKDIAKTMHLSVKTVDNHCTSLMTKLDIHDRVDLARFAIREGLAEP